MTLRKRVLRIGAFASVPQFIDFLTRFARTIILSRLLAPDEFGIAVAVTVVLTIAELTSDLGTVKFLMSRPRKQDRAALAAAHGLVLVRGAGLAAVTAAAAPWIAVVFGVPQSAAAFRWCAAILLLRAFANLQITQAQRDFHYGPEAIAMLASRVAALIAVVPAVIWFGDYRVMIASQLADAAVYVVLSHCLADLRYSLVSGNRRIFRELLAYGLPLTFNGALWAANSQADRAVVSHWLGIQALALYAVMFNLATVPVAVVHAVLGLLGMSLLARAQDSPALRRDSYLALVWVHAVVAAALSVSVAALLDLLVPLIYGPQYQVPAFAQSLLALIVWARVNRGGPNTAMLSSGSTRPLMAGTAVLAIGIGLAMLLLPMFPVVETMLACLLLGEVLSLVFFLHVAGLRTNVSRSAVGLHLAWSLTPVAAASAVAALLAPNGLWWRIGVLGVSALITGAQAVVGLRRHLLQNGLLGRSAGPGTAVAGLQ